MSGGLSWDDPNADPLGDMQHMKQEAEEAYLRMEQRPRTFYGDPDDPIEDLLEHPHDPLPKVGDILCDGHQMHYIWNGERWA